MKTADYHDLSRIEEDVSRLLRERRNLLSELKDLRRKRSEVLGLLHQVSEGIKSIREELSRSIAESRSLTAQRRELLEKIRGARSEVGKTAPEARRFKGQLGAYSRADLETKLSECEWRLQTQRLSRDEEKELVGRIRELEAKLRDVRIRLNTEEKLAKLSSDITSLGRGLDEISKRRQTVEQQIVYLRGKLREQYESKDGFLDKLGSLKHSVEERERALEGVEVEIEKLMSNRKKIVDEKKSKELKELKERERQMRNHIRKEVKARLADGKSVSFDELKLALEEDEGESLK